MQNDEFVILTEAVASSSYGSWRQLEYRLTGKTNSNLTRKVKSCLRKMHDLNVILEPLGYAYELIGPEEPDPNKELSERLERIRRGDF